MIIEDKVKDEKLQYDINREAAKVSALSAGEIDNYEAYKHLLMIHFLMCISQKIIGKYYSLKL